MTNSLHALSLLDGRYAKMTAPLSEFFSEFAFLQDRLRVELDFLAALSKTGLTRSLAASESAKLESIKTNYSSADAESILEYEHKARCITKLIGILEISSSLSPV